MIHYCAPTLCGIKPGNVFFIKKRDFSKSDFESWKKMFSSDGFSCECFSFKLTEDYFAVLVCNSAWIKKILSEPEVRSYLSEKSYACSDAESFVQSFKRRLHAPQENNLVNSHAQPRAKKVFPHEIGVVLGYPLEDVIAFEKHCGKDCQYCGSWKTYSNVEYTKKCQCNYKKCSFMCEKMYQAGYTLFQIVDEYKKMNDRMAVA